jgi:hypothetical protein
MFKDLLPLKGNLEFGYLYQFGKKVSTSRFTFDGLLPARTGHDGAAFGEFHGEFVNFGNTLRSLITFGNTTTSERGVNDRIDLSFGGGYRKIFGESLLVGVNGFYDTSRLWNQWYGSAGVGLEMAALGAGSDLIDLNFNYYGNLFQGRNSIINAFRNGPGNFDVEVGYSLELGAYGPDLRLKLTGYQFDVGSKVWGLNSGAEIRSRNGMFGFRVEGGRDKINNTYYTVGGFVNIGIQVENLASGQSPFTAPEPIFQSPRNLRRLLARKVNRNWHKPASVVLATATTSMSGPERCPHECVCPWDETGPPGAVLVATIDIGTVGPGETVFELPEPHVTLVAGDHYYARACDDGPAAFTGAYVSYAAFYYVNGIDPIRTAIQPGCLRSGSSKPVSGDPIHQLRVYNATYGPYCAGRVYVWAVPDP